MSSGVTEAGPGQHKFFFFNLTFIIKFLIHTLILSSKFMISVCTLLLSTATLSTSVIQQKYNRNKAGSQNFPSVWFF